MSAPKRLLILIVAYNAEKTISEVLARVPHGWPTSITSRCWCSTIRRRIARSSRAAACSARARCRSRSTCSSTRSTRDTAATRRSATTSRSSAASTSSRWCTATGSTRRSVCPDLVRPLRDGEADAVFGSRMLERGGARARRHAALQVHRQPDPELVPEPDARASRSANSTPATASTRSRRCGRFRSS